MQGFILSALLGAGLLAAAPAQAAVSISVGEPGFYGTIDIGGAPPPQVVYQQPMVIAPPRHPAPVPPPPLYLRVPPGHVKHWAKYCNRYNACGRPVYFVQDQWYSEVYVPHYRQAHVASPPPPQRYEERRDRHDHDHDRRDGPPPGRPYGGPPRY